MGNPLRIPLVLVLVGAALGAVLGIGLGLIVVVVLGGEPEPLPPPETTTCAIQASVAEAYINRILVESAADMPGPITISAGHLDLKPGGMADFDVKLQAGPFHPVVAGTVGFRATDDGRSVELLIVDANVGRLRLKKLIPQGALDRINADIKRLLIDEIGSQGLKVRYVDSNETTLRVGLGPDMP